MNLQEVANRLSGLRNEKKMTPLQLSKLIEVDYTEIEKWEAGERYPDVDKLPLLASAFDVSIDYLLMGETEKTQRVFVGPPYSIYSYGRVLKYGIIDKVNQDYLTKGWHVVHSHITPSGDGEECVLLVLEK